MSIGSEIGVNSSSSSVNKRKGKGLFLPPPPPPPPHTIAQHPLDPKKLKRLMNNRESSLLMRMRKEQNLMDMVRCVQAYKDQVNTLPIGIENTGSENKLLRKENNDLRTKMFTLSNYRDSKGVEEIMLRQEVEELNQFYHSQIDEFMKQEQQFHEQQNI
ncbi:basic leucine zipper 61-like [Dioscorea cayenensis subsp. rotundata]|uniref:Basic leucine zipper 61-like n=1 Tax=Dioscorea cayennensis subsp. rotundata TaxID=55577 RepID=A0AB40D196_DIOCR|nr:basic leucine zipper 61-like [Dioscorea cayenensis subsp. rotundata]